MHDQAAMPERFSEWNEQMVARHDPERFHHHPRAVVRWTEGRRVRAVLKLLRAAPAHRVLEVGCGAGNLLERVRADARVGLDLSRAMSSRARKRLPASAAVFQGDAEQMPFAGASFDRVLCSSLLSHVLHPELVLDESWRVLRPGGRLVVSVSYEATIERGIRLARKLGLGGLLLGDGQHGENVYNSEYHLHHFDEKLLRESAANLPTESLLRKIPWLYPVHIVAAYDKPGA
ncbi:MAG: methyltransferase domain-containing protein [Planctomycetota bacterium]|nr:methyltransferase domain-containing protein [Planctomycetota bacterium]